MVQYFTDFSEYASGVQPPDWTKRFHTIFDWIVSKTFEVESTSSPGAPTNLQFETNCGDGCTITEKTGITN